MQLEYKWEKIAQEHYHRRNRENHSTHPITSEKLAKIQNTDVVKVAAAVAFNGSANGHSSGHLNGDCSPNTTSSDSEIEK